MAGTQRPAIAVMLTNLLNYLNDIQPIAPELWIELERELEVVEVPKKTLLLKDGQRCDYVYVVLQGLLRMYYIKDGEEICSRFMEEGHMCISVYSFFSRNIGYEYIETLENCVMARIHYDTLQRIYKTHPEFNFNIRVVTEQYFIRSEERLYLLRKHQVDERYHYFADRYPSLLLRVPLKYIAGYLGTTVETLSRVRNKLRHG